MRTLQKFDIYFKQFLQDNTKLQTSCFYSGLHDKVQATQRAAGHQEVPPRNRHAPAGSRFCRIPRIHSAGVQRRQSSSEGKCEFTF